MVTKNRTGYFTTLELSILSLIAASITATAVALIAYSYPTLVSGFDLGSFLGLFIPSIIGVTGSYVIYNRRKAHQAKTLRAGLTSEVKQMKHIDNLHESWEDAYDHSDEDATIPPEKMPASSQISTEIYQSNTGRLGGLPKEEVEKIVRFYTVVIYAKDLMEGIRNEELTEPTIHNAFFDIMVGIGTLRQDIEKMLDGDLQPNEVKFPDQGEET